MAVVGDDNKVSIRPVTVGERVGKLWIVSEGLKPGERVVMEGLLKVRDGAAVKPVASRLRQGRKLAQCQNSSSGVRSLPS